MEEILVYWQSDIMHSQSRTRNRPAINFFMDVLKGINNAFFRKQKQKHKETNLGTPKQDQQTPMMVVFAQRQAIKNPLGWSLFRSSQLSREGFISSLDKREKPRIPLSSLVPLRGISPQCPTREGNTSKLKSAISQEVDRQGTFNSCIV